VERVEIDLLQPSLDFSRQASAAAPAVPGRDASLVWPAASFRERRLAALIDAGALLLACGVFLALFAALGGRLTVSRLDAAVLLMVLALFYMLYFGLFTMLSRATPGMMLRNLRLATFDGGEPQMRHLAWRSFGYLVSAGAMALGFLWALWDEEHLCWHDRISHTHLTGAIPARGEPDI
jgi:uncharacterized RDD family membrane protein YckC